MRKASSNKLPERAVCQILIQQIAKLQKWMLLATLALISSACAYRQVTPEPGEGIAYVLNTVVSQHSEPQPLYIDGNAVAELRPGEFTWIQLSPGSYAITVSGSPFQGRTLSSGAVEIEAGQVRYLVYDEEESESYLIEYSEQHAKRWLRGRRYVSSSHLGRGTGIDRVRRGYD